MIKSTINSSNSGDSLIVSPSGSIPVYLVSPPIAPVGTENVIRSLSQLFSSAGDGTGTANMNVDGSVTTQEFFINSSQECDIFLLNLVVVVADSAIVHNRFGNVPILTNGVTITVTESGTVTTIIDAVKTGGQFIAQSGALNTFGDGSTMQEVTNWTGNEDAMVLSLPLGVFVPTGIRLGRGRIDSMRLQINDDLTGLTEFTIRAQGFCHYPRIGE